MDGELCSIWYTNYWNKEAKLRCGFRAWPNWFVDWVVEKVKPGFITSEKKKVRHNNIKELTSTIPWLNFKWSGGDRLNNESEVHVLTHDQWLEFLSKWNHEEAYQRFINCMLNVIAIQENDYRKCPSQGWDYIGVIDRRPSNNQLVWEKCGYQWDDPSLYPFLKRMYKNLTNCFSLNSEHLNNFQKIMRGEPWPNCGIWVFKSGGWNHMVCAKWGYEFCWMCLGNYPSYRHTEQTFWPMRSLITTLFIVYLLVFSIDIKLWIRFEIFRYYEKILLDWATFVICSNLYACAAFLEITFISFAKENFELMLYFPQYEAVYRRQYLNFFILSLIYPFTYVGTSILLYLNFEYFQDMVNLVMHELMMFFIFSVIFGILFWIYRLLCFKNEEVLIDDQFSQPSIEDGKSYNY